MVITSKAIKVINTPTVRRELSGLLQCTEQTIIRYIRKNEANGPLTAVGVVRKVTELTRLPEKEILKHN